MAEPIRIVIADDHPLFREGVFHSLSSDPGLAVGGQAESGEEALRLAVELLPDVVLLDIGMPGWGGLATVEKLSRACPVAKVVMLTVFDDEDKLIAAFRGGARGYGLKGLPGGGIRFAQARRHHAARADREAASGPAERTLGARA